MRNLSSLSFPPISLSDSIPKKGVNVPSFGIELALYFRFLQWTAKIRNRRCAAWKLRETVTWICWSARSITDWLGDNRHEEMWKDLSSVQSLQGLSTFRRNKDSGSYKRTSDMVFGLWHNVSGKSRTGWLRSDGKTEYKSSWERPCHVGALFFWKEDVIYDKQIAGVPNKYPYHEQVIQNPNGSNIDSHMAPNSLKFASW